MNYQDETMDIVNMRDEVVGKASQEAVYTNKHLHRIVHIMAKDPKGRFGIQLRSVKKSYKPGHWATAACGHPQAGESYQTAGQRETLEELRQEVPLTNFRKLFYQDPERPGLERFLGAFEITISEPVLFDTEEVQDFQFFTHDQLQQMIDNGALFHPELLFILVNLYEFTQRGA